jgi:DNA helicase-2/ATP-dependent DNA helicase PcrA
MTGVSLDHSQLTVAHLPSSHRSLVIAGPGQGKTEVVAARLDYLIAAEEIIPADELLVLSFSRAATAAARHRLGAARQSASVSVRTFDSFASRLLVEQGVEPKGGFDERVRQATAVLKDEVEEIASVEMLRHLIVDEVQDLVGDRAEMVLALIERLSDGAGFTALGDPYQALYDFQLDDSVSALGNEELLRNLVVRLGAERYHLEGDYRALKAETRRVTKAIHEVRATGSPSRQLDLLEALQLELPDAGAVEDVAEVLPRWTGTTALLCQTNGQAIVISKLLSEMGVANSMRRPAQELAVPAWVARLLADAPSHQVRRDFVLEHLPTLDTQGPTPEVAWRLLKDTERGRHRADHLDLLVLGRRIRTGDVPAELLESDAEDVVVSTVHRAKGLEFDNVLVMRGKPAIGDIQSTEARARELTVALTRGRCRVCTFEAPDMQHVYLDTHCHPDRWVRGGWKQWMTTGFEVKPGDAETRFPPATSTSDAEHIQRNLTALASEQVYPVSAVLDEDQGRDDAPIYKLVCQGMDIGITTESFAEALGSRLDKVWRGFPAWPERLDELHLQGAVSVSGDPELGTNSKSAGRWGLWLAPRIFGLARLTFPQRKEGSE